MLVFHQGGHLGVGPGFFYDGSITGPLCRRPAVYVNYFDYDEAAHAFGPSSRPAMVSLTRVDRAIRRLYRVSKRVPEHQHDLYILSNHGQTACKPYCEINGGQPFERWIFDHCLRSSPIAAKEDSSVPSGLVHGIRSRCKAFRGFSTIPQLS